MKADRDGIDADPQDDRDVRVAQLFPGDEAEELLVVRAEALERRHGRAATGRTIDNEGLAPEAIEEPDASVGPPPLIREDPSGDGVQPGEAMFLGRSVTEAAPGHQEGLRGGLLRVGRVGRASEAEREDPALVGGVQTLEGRAINRGMLPRHPSET